MPSGNTSSEITITDSDLPEGGTITIDISSLQAMVASGTLSVSNVDVSSDAAAWTADVSGGLLILESADNASVVGESITVTLTGIENPWIADSAGEQIIPLAVTRNDTGQAAVINFAIETVVPLTGGISITSGDKILSPTGETVSVITITDADVPAESTIEIDISGLHGLVAGGTITTDNIVVASDSAAATWIGTMQDDILVLASSGGSTVAGESVIVTFTGAGGSPWVSDTSGEQIVSLTINRTDTGMTASTDFIIETALPPAAGLSVADGLEISTRTGETAPVFTVIDSDIPQDGTITIDISSLHGVVANGTFTAANVRVQDTAAGAQWSGAVEGDMLTLASTGGPTAVGETITVIFTGAFGSAWISDTGGAVVSSILTATRTDTGDASAFNFILETALGPGNLIVSTGEKVTASDGASSIEITVTDAPILQYDTILIDSSGLDALTTGGALTDANLVISDTAAAADWSAALDGGVLWLASRDGMTAPGESVTVTFTGSEENPWVTNTGGEQVVILTVLRMDNYASAESNFVIETAPPPGFTIMEGENITAAEGASSVVFTLSDVGLEADGSISMDISGLHPYVVGGAFADINVIVNDSAAAAEWTATVAGDALTLTSAGGPTQVDEAVIVTFTGAGGAPWIPNSLGVQTIPMTAFRSDIGGPGRFTITIETAPPPGYIVASNFTAVPTDDIVPLTVSFTDLSTGNATSWVWDFGDGDATNATDQNPVHTYATAGSYAVTLTVANEYGSDTKTQWNYIHALNGGVRQETTGIDGLALTITDGVQTVHVNTSILPAVLMPNSSVLEIQPPADSGWRSISLYALDGNGFTQNETDITGTITGVHMATADIAPLSGFSGTIGTGSALWLSFDLPSYPVDATFNAKFWEGTMPEFEDKLNTIAVGNGAVSIGTAYAATITKTNIPAGVPVTVHMSVGSDWNPSLSGGPGSIFIWRIADDGNSGQILPTTLGSTDPVSGLENYAAESPNGMSTFGISSFTGSNNPFQMIALAAQEAVSQPSGGTSSIDTGGSGDSGVIPVPTTAPPVAPVTPGAPSSPLGAAEYAMIEKIYTNPDGIISQASAFTSSDGLVKIDIPLGVVAKNGSGLPLETVSIRKIPNGEIPAVPPDSGFSFAGVAYDIQPEGATFSPPIAVAFTVPPDGTDFVVQQYNPVTNVWVQVPVSYDQNSGTIVAQVSHLCYIALFTKSPGATSPVPTILTSEERAEKGLAKTALPISGGLLAFVTTNPILVAVIAIVVAVGGAVVYAKMQARRKIAGVHHPGDDLEGSGITIDRQLERKREQAFTGIINVLNDIDGQVRDLDRTMRSRAPAFVFPTDEAAPIVDRFFYACQVAEERIKAADHEGHLTKKQVHDLNIQLQASVQRMVELARRSETLQNLVTDKFGAEAGQ